MKTYEEMTAEEQIDFLMEALNAYRYMFVALEPKLKFYPALKKDAQIIYNVQERAERAVQAYCKAKGKPYHPALNAANRGNSL